MRQRLFLVCMFFFWWQRDFPIRFSNRGTSRILKSSLRKLYCWYECLMTFWMLFVYNDTLHRSDFTPNLDLITNLNLLPNYERFVFMEHLRRVLHVDRGCLLCRSFGMSHLRLNYVLLVDTNHLSKLVMIFPDVERRSSFCAFWLQTLQIIFRSFLKSYSENFCQIFV